MNSTSYKQEVVMHLGGKCDSVVGITTLTLLYFLFRFWVLYICLITLPNKLDILVGEDCVVIFTSDTVFRVGETTQYKIMAYFLTDSSTPNRVLNGAY